MYSTLLLICTFLVLPQVTVAENYFAGEQALLAEGSNGGATSSDLNAELENLTTGPEQESIISDIVDSSINVKNITNDVVLSSSVYTVGSSFVQYVGSQFFSLLTNVSTGVRNFFSSFFSTPNIVNPVTIPSVVQKPTPIPPTLPTPIPSPPVQNVQKTTSPTIIERIITRTIERTPPPTLTVRGISEATLTSRLEAMSNTLKSEIYRMASLVSSNATRQSDSNFSAIALTQRIDNLANVTVSNATITGSSFAGSLSGTTGSFSNSLTSNSGIFSALSIAGQSTFTTASSTGLAVTGSTYLATEVAGKHILTYKVMDGSTGTVYAEATRTVNVVAPI